MTDYNDGKWHGWNGGECPVDPRCMVEAVWHDPNTESAGVTGPRRAKEDDPLATTLAWSHVVKFRVTTPAPPKPREWWRSESDGQTYLCEPHDNAVAMDGFVRVREVLE